MRWDGRNGVWLAHEDTGADQALLLPAGPTLPARPCPCGPAAAPVPRVVSVAPPVFAPCR